MKLLLLFTVVPLCELLILLFIASNTSFLFTVALILTTALIGANMLRWQGLIVWRRLQMELAQGKLPQDSLIDGVLILMGGVMMITPGLLTDLVGLLTLIPATRRMWRENLKRNLKGRIQITRFGTGPMSEQQPTAESHDSPFRDDSPFAKLHRHDDRRD